MSIFEVKIRKIDSVETHPNADALDLAVIGGYKAVVKRNEFKAGDLALYIPDDALFTDITVAEKLGVAPYLTGKQKNRVKPVRLRGALSQGIVIPLEKLHLWWDEHCRIKAVIARENNKLPAYWASFEEGEDWTEILQIIKYEEPIPIQMQGKVRPWPGFLEKYDVENIKRPESMMAMIEGEQVIATEKLHGTNVTYAVTSDGDFFVCSRNTSLEEDDRNLYWQIAKKLDIRTILQNILFIRNEFDTENPIRELSLHGEIVGIQDLRYGHSKESPEFYAFDIRINGQFVDFDLFTELCDAFSIKMVPVLYEGPYNYELMNQRANQALTNLEADHIMEGLVVRPKKERYDSFAGRVQFKFISEAYLLRKGNTTEYH